MSMFFLQLVELLDNPLHDYFKQNECLNYFFCFRWILICFKRLEERSSLSFPFNFEFMAPPVVNLNR